EGVMRILQGTPYSLPKRSIVRPLLKALAERGVEAMVAQYRELAASQDQDYDSSERALNSLGYRLLGMGKPLAAIEVFKLNVERYPESANVYDSLAEAYMTNDDRQPAIENYQRSLDLDPGNTNAVQKLRELREQ
ncbi:MAG: serine hydrolase, partial [Actinomycetia bacterium]|nr:serine hydrolase [Actinomycetes bacterium]